jgi:hypothetical protein
MYDTSSWTILYTVYRYNLRIFLAPLIKKKYVIKEHNLYSYETKSIL